jgi:hypothetical protein
MFIKHKRLHVSLLEFLFVIIVIVQPLKSNWRGAPVRGSIEELSI